MACGGNSLGFIRISGFPHGVWLFFASKLGSLGVMRRQCVWCEAENSCVAHGKTNHCPSTGSRKRWRCTKCKWTWVERPDKEYITKIAPPAVLRTKGGQIKAIALFAMGVPMRAIEGEFRLKGETIKKTLMKFHIGGLWSELADIMDETCPNVSADRIDEIEQLFKKIAIDKQALHEDGMRRRQNWDAMSHQQQEHFFTYVTSPTKSNPPAVTPVEL